METHEHPERGYIGESRFLRWLPMSFAALAFVTLVVGAPGVSLFLLLLGFAMSARLPWRFEVDAEGVGLFFGLRGYRFFRREAIVLRAGLGGAALFPAHARLAYPLTAGMVEHDRTELRRRLLSLGFDVVD